MLDTQQVLALATDARGVIQFVNRTFFDISGYNSHDLLGAPHRITRHPDMPYGLFFLIWERLKADLPACVYMKNLSAGARDYRTFATIAQISGGYLSVCFTPQADLEVPTQAVDKAFCQREAAGHSAQESADYLLICLKDMGFESVEAYMQAAMAQEVALRPDSAPERHFMHEQLSDLLALIARVKALVTTIADIFRQARGGPVNLRILVGRMEQPGAAIARISKNYEVMSSDMYDLVVRLYGHNTGGFTRMRCGMENGRFAAQVAEVMKLNATVGNGLSQSLKELKSDCAGTYTEIFVSDGRSLNVGQSDMTSDCW